MEKRLRSSLRTSAEEFLSSAVKSGFTKSTKSSLKTLIHSISPSSELTSSLPPALHSAISQSIHRFKSSSSRQGSPRTPPAKRPRRSSRKRQKDDTPDTNTENAKSSVLDNLQVYAHVASLCVSNPKGAFSVSDLHPGVLELHDNLVLFESESTLLLEIANLCEEWWKRDLAGKETLISQSLPFWLSRSLTVKKKVDVHRVYGLREAFLLFDFEDESIEDLKNLLIRCVISPLYFKTEEGRKFVAFMFGLSGQLVKEALALIKSQIPFGKKSMLEAYGEIVFRAWKAADGDSKDAIENEFLQGLIDSAIHAGSGALAASIRRVLGVFIVQRTTDGVEKLLFRLAEPVIFRSLQVANSNVRQNALLLLLDLFPLEDPDATKEVEDNLLQKQFFLLEKLLMDECPDVRVVAVEGGCRILNLFWEVIPSSAITKTLTKIFDDLTHDTCTEVRLSTVNGIMYLLGNPHSHEILKVLLPRMGHLILDVAMSVRAAILDLLVLASDIRNFQFHKVVRLDLLLSTLANDHQLLGQKITKLLIPSYFPSRVTQEEACNRCIALIKRSPVAGARFCEFLASQGASSGSRMELFGAIISLTLSQDKGDAHYISSLLSAVSHVCENLVNDESQRNFMKEVLSGEKLQQLFAVATSSHAKSCVCKIVTAISPDTVDGLFKECLGLIMNCANIREDMDRQIEVRSAHKMVSSCGWFEGMFDAMVKHLQKTVHLYHERVVSETDRSTKRRKTKSTSRVSSKSDDNMGKKSPINSGNKIEKDLAVSAGIAWQLKELLSSENARNSLLASRNLKAAFSAVKALSEASILECLQSDTMCASPVSAYAALSLNMYLQHVSISCSKSSSTRKKACLDTSESSPECVSWESILGMTTDHFLKCSHQLFRESACEKCGVLLWGLAETTSRGHSCGQNNMENRINDSGTSDAYSSDKLSRISNMLEVLTAVLKFIVDATTLDVDYYNPERCLKYALEYVKFIICNLRGCYKSHLEFREEDLAKVVFCLKISFTYAAKYLSSLLKSSSVAALQLRAPHDLAHELLNLFASVEEYLGYKHAARLLTSIKPWVPDLIIALGSWHLLKQTSVGSASDYHKSPLPLWESVLAKIELYELQDIVPEEEAVRVSKSERYSGFNKLAQIMIQLLKANSEVLDVVGVTFLKASLIGLERKDFDLVLGLLHFVCMKLATDEEWEKLKLMLEMIQKIYPQLEVETKRSSNTEDEKEMLKSARGLLEPVWMHYFSGEDGNTMDEE
ncbi:OLC1v1011465C1 [Oldenlandia corymbosa var. corymbosa]|uniref:OLC1v1011465C1 n=1 Tax=Oldenlandia corymbosa var. corymbosa TaxID=529605 RepID=A0AAV1DWQ9_OLDCO|nr:OLC1v1011465C1 [Oldenlandia corymbosa var. corymbosa]